MSSEVPEFELYPEEMHLKHHDLEEISRKQHALQRFYLNQNPGFTVDDCFGLPLPYLRALHEVYLCFKRGTGRHKRGYGVATYDVSPEDPWFYCHFLGDPVMPGSQGQDALFQLAGIWSAFTCKIKGRPRALGGAFSFFGQILPISTRVYYRVDITRFLEKKQLMLFTGSIAVDREDNIIYEFDECRIGFFQREQLNIPGRAIEYYRPDWNKVKQEQSKYIAQSQAFYETVS